MPFRPGLTTRTENADGRSCPYACCWARFRIRVRSAHLGGAKLSSGECRHALLDGSLRDHVLDRPRGETGREHDDPSFHRNSVASECCPLVGRPAVVAWPDTPAGTGEDDPADLRCLQRNVVPPPDVIS